MQPNSKFLKDIVYFIPQMGESYFIILHGSVHNSKDIHCQLVFFCLLFTQCAGQHFVCHFDSTLLCLLKALKCISTSTLFFIFVSQNGLSGETYEHYISQVRSHLFSFTGSKGNFSGIDLSSCSIFLLR